MEDGSTVTAPELTANKGTATISNVVNYYKVAKYASYSLMHNNCGEINPIGDGNESSTGNYKAEDATASFYTSGNWSDYVEEPAEMSGLNKSYQVYLHNHLKWQEVNVEVVDLAGNTKTVSVLKGVDYTNILSDDGGTFSGSFTGIANGSCLGIVPTHELANLGVKPNDGMKIKFVSNPEDPTSVVDLIKDDTKLYAIQVAANA